MRRWLWVMCALLLLTACQEEDKAESSEEIVPSLIDAKSQKDIQDYFAQNTQAIGTLFDQEIKMYTDQQVCGSASFFLGQLTIVNKYSKQQAEQLYNFISQRVDKSLQSTSDIKLVIKKLADKQVPFYQQKLVYCQNQGKVFGDKISQAIAADIHTNYYVMSIKLGGTASGFDDLLKPWLIPHKGGSLVYPEETLEAYQAGITDQSLIIDADIHLLADGTLGVIHDAIVDNVTTSSGLTQKFNLNTWNNLVVDSENWFGYGYKNTKLLTFTSLVSDFSGDDLFIVEAKHNNAMPSIVNAVISQGVPKNRVILTSFTLSELQSAINAGYKTGLILSQLNSKDNWQAIYNQGVSYIIYQTTTEDEKNTVSSLKSIGFKIIKWTVSRRSRLKANQTINLDGIYVEDYPYLAHAEIPITLKDTWDTGRWMAGMIPSNSRGALFPQGQWGYNETTLGYQGALQGWACPTMPFFTLSVDIKIDDVLQGDVSNWASLFISADDDSIFVDDAEKIQGYHLVIRLNGLMQIYKKDKNKKSVLVAQKQTTPLSLGQFVPIKVSVDQDKVVFKRTDSDESVITEDKDYRGGYFHLGRNGSAAKFRNLSVDW